MGKAKLIYRPMLTIFSKIIDLFVFLPILVINDSSEIYHFEITVF